MGDHQGFLETHRRWLIGGLLAGLVLAGILAFKDYGIAWDEPVQRQYGSEVYEYVVHHDQALFLNRHRYYGPVFEMALYSLEKAFALTDTRSIYMMRHLVNFLVLWAGACFFFLLVRYLFRSWKVGLLGSVLLILSPRIFAHGFYNTKDTPFLSVFIAAVYTMLRCLDAKTIRAAAVHGAVCGILIATRIMGIMLPALTVTLWGYDLLRGNAGGAAAGAADGVSVGRARGWAAGARRIGGSLVAYVLVLAGVTVLLWPTLWRDPFRNFVRVFEGMRNFPWEAPVLYLGKYVWSTKLPWHYTPVWIGISTPLVYIVLFGVGLVACALSWGRRGQGRFPLLRRDVVVVLGWFFLPLIYFMASRAVLYDEWRHSFFIYPAFLLIALTGLVWLWRLAHGGEHAGRQDGSHCGSRAGLRGGPRGAFRRIAPAVLIFGVALGLGSTATFMIRHHPFENVFFNSLAGGVKGAGGKFEMDYWGLSYRKGLEYILAADRSPEIPVFAATAPGRYNADILKPEDRRRLVFVTEVAKARYCVTNFRWESRKFRPESEIFSVKIDGVELMAVYKL